MKIVQGSLPEKSPKFPLIPLLLAGAASIAAYTAFSFKGELHEAEQVSSQIPAKQAQAPANLVALPVAKKLPPEPATPVQSRVAANAASTPKVEMPGDIASAPAASNESLPDAATLESAFKTTALLEKSFSAAASPPRISLVAPTEISAQTESPPPKQAVASRGTSHVRPGERPAHPTARPEPVAKPKAPSPVAKADSIQQLKTLVIPVQLPAVPPTWPAAKEKLPSVPASHPGAQVSRPVEAQKPHVALAPVTPIPVLAAKEPASTPKNPMVLPNKMEPTKTQGFKPVVLTVSGGRAWVKISQERVIIVQSGEQVPGLGKFNGSLFTEN